MPANILQRPSDVKAIAADRDETCCQSFHKGPNNIVLSANVGKLIMRFAHQASMQRSTCAAVEWEEA